MRGSCDLPLAILVGIGLAIIRLSCYVGFIEEFEDLDVEFLADLSATPVKHDSIIDFRNQWMDGVEIGVQERGRC